MRSRCPSGPKHRRKGFTLIEVIFALSIFLMMVVVFGAVFPIAITAARFSNNYSQAAELCQHKIDELHGLPWSGYTSAAAFSAGAGQMLVNNNIADAGTCSSSPDANGGFTCSFVNTDNIANNGSNIGYFPSGATAIVTVDPDKSTGVPSYSVFNATVTISWTGGGISSGSYTAAAKLVEDVTP